jgi:hypothetical protein
MASLTPIKDPSKKTALPYDKCCTAPLHSKLCKKAVNMTKVYVNCAVYLFSLCKKIYSSMGQQIVNRKRGKKKINSTPI